MVAAQDNATNVKGSRDAAGWQILGSRMKADRNAIPDPPVWRAFAWAALRACSMG